MPSTESRQVRRARQRYEAAPRRLFEQSPHGNRATRRMPARRRAFLVHPTKASAPMSARRIAARLTMAAIFRLAEARRSALQLLGPNGMTALELGAPTLA
jgi:hypothetical protein